MDPSEQENKQNVFDKANKNKINKIKVLKVKEKFLHNVNMQFCVNTI
jgi:hypothetical protein